MLYGTYPVTISNSYYGAFLLEFRKKMLMPRFNNQTSRSIKLYDINNYANDQPVGLSLISRNKIIIGVGYRTNDYNRCFIYKETDGTVKLFIDGKPETVEGLELIYDSIAKQVKLKRPSISIVNDFK